MFVWSPHDDAPVAAPKSDAVRRRQGFSVRSTPVRSAVSSVGGSRGSLRATAMRPALKPMLHGQDSSSPQRSVLSCTPKGAKRSKSQDNLKNVRRAGVTVGVLTATALAETTTSSVGYTTPPPSPSPPSPLGEHARDGGSATASIRLSPHVAQRRYSAGLPTLTNGYVPRSIHRRLSMESAHSCLSNRPAIDTMGGSGALLSRRATTSSSATTPRFSLTRPFFSSKEADYLNVSNQRSFLGRFRCATLVVVRTPATATLHSSRALSPGDDGCQPDLCSDVDTQEETTTVSACAAVTAGPEWKDGLTRYSADTELRAHSAEMVPKKSADVSSSYRAPAGHPASLPAACGLQPKSRSRASSSGLSVGSGGTAGCHAGRGRHPSTSKEAHTHTRCPSSMSGAALSPSSLTSVEPWGSCAAARGSRSAANMDSLVKSGLHTSLWLAVQDGGLEVRSAANPNQVLTRLPRRDPRAVITSLAEICGNRVVAGLTDGTLHVYDAVSLKETEEKHAHTAAVTCLHYMRGAPPESFLVADDTVPQGNHRVLPTQSLLLTGALDGSIVVWRAASMSHLHLLRDGSHSICTLAATVTGGYAFSGSDDGTLRMWDVVQGIQLRISKEERVSIVEGGCLSGSLTTEPQPQSPVAPSTLDPTVTDKLSTPATLRATGKGQTQASRETTVRKSTTLAPGTHQRPSLNSVSAKNFTFAAGCMSPPLTYHSTEGLCHRSVELYGGIGKGSQTRHATTNRKPLMEGCTPRQIQRATGDENVSPLLSHSSFSSLVAAAEEAAFAPTNTDTKLSLFRDGSVLVGPGQGISPLRCDLTRYVEDEADTVGPRQVSSATDRHLCSADRDSSTPMPCTPRTLKQIIKRRAKSVQKQRGAFTYPSIAAASTCGESKNTSAPSVAGKSVKRNKDRSEKCKRNTVFAAELAKVRTRRAKNPLEKRLESWLYLYRRRVLLSAASAHLTQVIPAAYDAVTAFNWPIEYAHKEHVTALTMVEDRLLVSGSRDTTAKVFALPSGHYVRTLASSRRIPLSGVLYDGSVGRLYTAFSDGSIAAYDTRNAELPLLSQTPLSQGAFSCRFVQLRTMPMRRFVWVAGLERGSLRKVSSSTAASSGLSSVIVVVAQCDRTTVAHGPHQNTASSRVGQPSVRELKAASSHQLLQQRRLLNLSDQVKRSRTHTLEERDLRDKRCSGLVLESSYLRQQMYRVFGRWTQWARRRALRSRCEAAVSAVAQSCALGVLWRYEQRWLHWMRARKRKAAVDDLRRVQLKGNGVVFLPVSTRVQEAHQRMWPSMAAVMERQRQVALLAAAYRRWIAFFRPRLVHLRQCAAFNTLLLSMNSSTYTPGSCTLAHMTRAATRRANGARALWLLIEKRRDFQERTTRCRYFRLWRTWARLRRRAAAIAANNRKREAPGSLTTALILPQQLRRRCFALWQDFALYVTRNDRLTSERDTLRLEWRILQTGVGSSITVEELKQKLAAAHSSIDNAKEETKRLEERLETASREAGMLRSEALLRSLLGGYRVPSMLHTEALSWRSTISLAAELSSTGSMRRGSLASSASMVLSYGCCGDVAPRSDTLSATDVDSAVEESPQQKEEQLLLDVSAVLRALKGHTMFYARDEELLLAAHTLALKLHIRTPAGCPSGSEDILPGRRPKRSTKRQRSSRVMPSWSVSNAKCGGLTAVSALSSSQQRHRPSLPGAGTVERASLYSDGTALSTAPATANNITSTHQMWAAQPAEETYACLADAFIAVYFNLSALMEAAAQEWGAAADDHCVVHSSAAWIARVPPKQRRIMVGEVLKLVTLFDSFVAHNDLPVECPGSISLRGSANVRVMPLGSLCSRDTAVALVEKAPVILELVAPNVLYREMELCRLQSVYAAPAAEPNNHVPSLGVNEAALQKSTGVLLNSPRSSDHGATPSPASRAMQPLAPRLLAGYLQEAGAGMPSQNTMSPGMSDFFGPLSIDQRGNRSASSIHSGPLNLTAFAPVPEGEQPTRVHSAEDPLGKSSNSEATWKMPNLRPPRVRSQSFSLRSYSGVSTPRAYTPRTTIGLQGDTRVRETLVKPYLGFRVHLNRNTQTIQRTTISICDVTPQYVNAEGVGVEGPAQVAGLQVGDQLVRFAGYAVTDLAAFNAVVSRHVHARATLPVVILRSGEQLHKTIVVGSRAVADV